VGGRAGVGGKERLRQIKLGNFQRQFCYVEGKSKSLTSGSSHGIPEENGSSRSTSSQPRPPTRTFAAPSLLPFVFCPDYLALPPLRIPAPEPITRPSGPHIYCHGQILAVRAGLPLKFASVPLNTVRSFFFGSPCIYTRGQRHSVSTFVHARLAITHSLRLSNIHRQNRSIIRHARSSRLSLSLSSRSPTWKIKRHREYVSHLAFGIWHLTFDI
jgi:hypothetical protein